MTTIGPAIAALQAGHRVRRACWDTRCWLAMDGENEIQTVSLGAAMRSRFVAHVDDLTARDWLVLPDDPAPDEDREDEPPHGSRVRDRTGDVWVNTGYPGSRVNWEREDENGHGDGEVESWTRVNEFVPIILLRWGYGVD
jgi:hypothetical protein